MDTAAGLRLELPLLVALLLVRMSGDLPPPMDPDLGRMLGPTDPDLRSLMVARVMATARGLTRTL